MKPHLQRGTNIACLMILMCYLGVAHASDHSVADTSSNKSRVLIDAKQHKSGHSQDYHAEDSGTKPNSAAAVNTTGTPGVQPVAPKPEPILVRVTGYGAYDVGKKNQSPEKRLMAIRASKLDAYRSLAERVYGFSLTGQSGMNNFALEHDEFKASVNSVVRGAKVVSISENPKTGIETVLELELPGDFHQCINRVNNFRYRSDCLRPITHMGQETAANLYNSEPKKDKRMRTLYHLK